MGAKNENSKPNRLESDAICQEIKTNKEAERYPDAESHRDGSYSQIHQDIRVEKLLPSVGFYVESGAANGVTHSNTLFYQNKGWDGLLVEPDPGNSRHANEHRNAYVVNAALSGTGELGTLTLHQQNCSTKTPAKAALECSTVSLANSKTSTDVEVKSIPLERLLACLSRSTVDFWSLDVEGFEAKILNVFPFDKIEVGVILVETVKDEGNLYNGGGENKKQVFAAVEKHGFKKCGHTIYDTIFVNPSYYAKRGLETPTTC